MNALKIISLKQRNDDLYNIQLDEHHYFGFSAEDARRILYANFSEICPDETSRISILTKTVEEKDQRIHQLLKEIEILNQAPKNVTILPLEKTEDKKYHVPRFLRHLDNPNLTISDKVFILEQLLEKGCGLYLETTVAQSSDVEIHYEEISSEHLIEESGKYAVLPNESRWTTKGDLHLTEESLEALKNYDVFNASDPLIVHNLGLVWFLIECGFRVGNQHDKEKILGTIETLKKSLVQV